MLAAAGTMRVCDEGGGPSGEKPQASAQQPCSRSSTDETATQSSSTSSSSNSTTVSCEVVAKTEGGEGKDEAPGAILSFGGQAAHRPCASSSTSSTTTTTGFRRGKWTQEEQDYAEQLITTFTAGTVANCDEGITLRAFLARELRCDRMRISKKFAGASIGKLIFRRRGPPDEEAERRLAELRDAFQRSVSTFSSGGGADFLPKSSPQQSARTRTVAPPPLLGQVGGKPTASSSGAPLAAAFVAASADEPTGLKSKPPPVAELLRSQKAVAAGKPPPPPPQQQQQQQQPPQPPPPPPPKPSMEPAGRQQQQVVLTLQQQDWSDNAFQQASEQHLATDEYAFVAVPHVVNGGVGGGVYSGGGVQGSPLVSLGRHSSTNQQLLAAATYNVEKAQRQHDAAQSALQRQQEQRQQRRSRSDEPRHAEAFEQSTRLTVPPCQPALAPRAVVAQCQALIQQRQPAKHADEEPPRMWTSGDANNNNIADPHHHGVASLKRSWRDAADMTNAMPTRPRFADHSSLPPARPAQPGDFASDLVVDDDDFHFNESLNFLISNHQP